MPVSRAELVAEFTIHPIAEGSVEPHVEAGAEAVHVKVEIQSRMNEGRPRSAPG
ncbi:MAG: hypothetical protein H0V97_00780 [Actinobacteria bacterium]|nr:hypothetical protein [Actinomycetota bacterium]